jgi:putative proteasome-type protease
MSYALGIRTEAGLVMAADSRTNAGPDQVSSFRKLHVFEKPGEKFIVAAIVGNLSLAQALVAELRSQDGRGRPKKGYDLLDAPSMADAARMTGQAIRALEAQDGGALTKHGVAFDVTALIGGQIGKERPRLFQVYPAGNFIEASSETPYFQIGERKYGKPVLDQTLNGDAKLGATVRAALLSMDATIHNNATVGWPADILALSRDQWRPALLKRISAEDPYLLELRRRWADGVKDLLTSLPDPPGLAKKNGATGPG